MTIDGRTENFVWIFIGGLIGALTIFFWVPKKEKTGKLLKDKGEELIDDVQEKISELERKEGTCQRGRHCCGKTRERASAHRGASGAWQANDCQFA